MPTASRKKATKRSKNQPPAPIPFPQPAETQSTEVETGIAVPDPPDTSETQLAEQNIKRTGRPSKDGLSFFERLKTYESTEWTNGRLVIYSYRYQPITDRRAGGNKSIFLMKYTSPIDEQTILMDHGSGVYHFKLNQAEDGQPKSYPIATADIEITNPKFPPNIPAGEWLEDPRNKKWAWAAPPGSIFHKGTQEAAAPSSGVTITEAFDQFNDIQDRAEERASRMQPAAQDPAQAAEATLKIVDRVVEAIKPKEDKESGSLMKTLFEQIAAERKRGDDLLIKLLEAKQAPAAAQPQQTGLGMIKELIKEVKEILPTVKEFMPEGVSASVVRREREPWYTGILQSIAEGAAPAIPVFVNGVMQYMQRQPQAQPQIIPNRGQQPQGPGAPAPMTINAAPAASDDPWEKLVNALEDEATGEDFAQSVIMIYGRFKYKMACMMGEAGLMDLLKSHAVWDRLGIYQDRMPEFIREFIAYGQEGEEPEGEPGEGDPAQPDIEAEQHQPTAAPIEL